MSPTNQDLSNDTTFSQIKSRVHVSPRWRIPGACGLGQVCEKLKWISCYISFQEKKISEFLRLTNFEEEKLSFRRGFKNIYNRLKHFKGQLEIITNFLPAIWKEETFPICIPFPCTVRYRTYRYLLCKVFWRYTHWSEFVAVWRIPDPNHFPRIRRLSMDPRPLSICRCDTKKFDS